MTVLVVSEYGIEDATTPVDVNRVLRRAGLLEVHTQAGMEYLDPWASRAFAVADHQIAHVYVRDPRDVGQVARLLAELDGVGAVLDDEAKRAVDLDHPRAGELVCVASPGAWFTYYYSLDDEAMPDFARTVEIHRKPGYDPAELFFDPADRTAKLRAGVALARKAAGLRYLMDVIPLDPTCVRGTHGRGPDDPSAGPVVIASDPDLVPETGRLADVKSLALRAAGHR